MTGSIALDVVIGLVFVYLLYSLLATIIQEVVANVLSLRAATLEWAIKRMLDDEGKGAGNQLSRAFYGTYLIKYLAEKEGKKPSYITANNFSKAILLLLKGKGFAAGEDPSTKIRNALDAATGITLSDESGSTSVNEGDTFEFLQSLWAEAQGDIAKFQGLLEQWFNDTMERATGWYKRKTQLVLFFIGLAIAALFNVDTVDITHKLSTDPKLREQLVRQAEVYAKEHATLKAELDQLKKSNTDSSKLKNAEASYEAFVDKNKVLVDKAQQVVTNDIANVNKVLALGWSQQGHTPWYSHIIGWLLTALAISLGAPFWFDLLNKLMKLRGSVQTVSSNSQESQTQKAGEPKRVG